jgi:hypothetical protein
VACECQNRTREETSQDWLAETRQGPVTKTALGVGSSFPSVKGPAFRLGHDFSFSAAPLSLFHYLLIHDAGWSTHSNAYSTCPECVIPRRAQWGGVTRASND